MPFYAIRQNIVKEGEGNSGLFLIILFLIIFFPNILRLLNLLALPPRQFFFCLFLSLKLLLQFFKAVNVALRHNHFLSLVVSDIFWRMFSRFSSSLPYSAQFPSRRCALALL